MVLTLEEVEHIADVARLELTDEEKARYQEQLSAILDYAARLQAVDTAEITAPSPTCPFGHPKRVRVSRPPFGGQGGSGTRSSPETASSLPDRPRTVGAHPALRPDRPHPGLSLDDLLRNAPQAEQDQFCVPPVFE